MRAIIVRMDDYVKMVRRFSHVIFILWLLEIAYKKAESSFSRVIWLLNIQFDLLIKLLL